MIAKHSPWRRANARNVSFETLNSNGSTKLPCLLFYRSSTTVSSETSAPDNVHGSHVLGQECWAWSMKSLPTYKIYANDTMKRKKKKSSFCTVLGTFKKKWIKLSQKRKLCLLSNSFFPRRSSLPSNWWRNDCVRNAIHFHQLLVSNKLSVSFAHQSN